MLKFKFSRFLWLLAIAILVFLFFGAWGTDPIYMLLLPPWGEGVEVWWVYFGFMAIVFSPFVYFVVTKVADMLSDT